MNYKKSHEYHFGFYAKSIESVNIDEKCSKCEKPYCDGFRHNSNNVYLYPTCKICGIELNDYIELIENKTSRSTNQCEICDLNYKSPHQVNSHFLSHFKKQSQKPEPIFLCMDCNPKTEPAKVQSAAEEDDEDFEEEAEYVDDTSTESEVDEDTQDGENRKTSKRTKTVVKKSVSTVSKETTTVTSVIRSGRKFLFPTMSTKFDCSACADQFETKIELNKHRKQAHALVKVDIAILKCRVCPESFDDVAARKLHEVELHQDRDTKMYNCPVCGVQRQNISSLANHLPNHSNEKPHICDICGKGFRRSHNLICHYETHSEVKIHKCNICEKSFNTLSLKNRHMRLAHTDDRPYECLMCDKTYKDFSDLRRHKWTHGGYEKKFSCCICGKKFFENKVLRNHMKVHSKCKRDPVETQACQTLNVTALKNDEALDTLDAPDQEIDIIL